MKTKPAPTRKPKALASRKPAEWDDSAAVDEHLRKLKHPLKPEMESLRAIILGASARITEGIKWNAPSFYCHGWFATYNVRGPDSLLIIFHQGAKVKASGTQGLKIKDDAGLLEWLAKDRCLARFTGPADVRAKKTALKSVVQQWVKLMA